MKIRVAIAAAALAACGSHPDTPPLPDGPLAGVCSGVTLATLPLRGIYHAHLVYSDGYEQATAFRIDDDGGGAPTMALGQTHVPVTVSASELKAVQGDQNEGRTVDVTGLDADCTLRGTWRLCTGGNCYDATLLARRVDRLDEPIAQGMTELGEFVGDAGDRWTDAGLAVNVRVANGIAYLATYQDGLRIVDAHDPGHLTALGHLVPEFPQANEIYNDVKIVAGAQKTWALVASDIAGVVVVDVTDPHAPAIVGHMGTSPGAGQATNVHTIFVDGGNAYLANIDLGLEIWALGDDPSTAVKIGAWAHDAAPGTQPFPHDLYVNGPRAYVNYWDAGMSIVDVSAPATPALVGDFANYGQHTSHSNWVTQIGNRMIAVHGDEQWDAHVHVVDVTEGTPAFATSIGEWRTRPEVSVHNIMAFGSRAYMAYYQDGVRVLDLSDPTAPKPIAWFDTFPGYDQRYGTSFYEAAVGIDLDLDHQLIYVADSVRGLIVLHLDV